LVGHGDTEMKRMLGVLCVLGGESVVGHGDMEMKKMLGILCVLGTELSRRTWI
jgi:hypothetical protein